MLHLASYLCFLALVGVQQLHQPQRLRPLFGVTLPWGRDDIREHDIVCPSLLVLQPHCCRVLGQAVHTATFHSSNVTAAMRQDIAASMPSLHTTACSLSEESICSLAAASRIAQVIPWNTSLQGTSSCTLHKLKLGVHLHRDMQCGFNP